MSASGSFSGKSCKAGVVSRWQNSLPGGGGSRHSLGREENCGLRADEVSGSSEQEDLNQGDILQSFTA